MYYITLALCKGVNTDKPLLTETIKVKNCDIPEACLDMLKRHTLVKPKKARFSMNYADGIFANASLHEQTGDRRDVIYSVIMIAKVERIRNYE